MSDEERMWGEGPEGHKDVIAYIDETPQLHALFLDAGLLGFIEAEDTETPQWDFIFAATNHWRERELEIANELKAPRPEEKEFRQIGYLYKSREGYISAQVPPPEIWNLGLGETPIYLRLPQTRLSQEEK